jgi:Copper transport outer membrane protein, MctB
VIDFRYHLVSIVAVFLALAIGIVLGSTELQGPTYNLLNQTTGRLQAELNQADGQRNTAQAQANLGESYAQAVEPVVLHNLLAGQRLLIVTEPGASPQVVTAISDAATQFAGATTTGEIALQPKFFDTSDTTQDYLNQTNLVLAQSDGITLESGTTYQQQAAHIIASEILTKAPGSRGSQATASPSATPSASPSAGTGSSGTGSPGTGSPGTGSPGTGSPGTGTSISASDTNAATMLTAYANSGFLTTSGQPSTPATLAVIVTPQTAPSDGSADPLDQMLVALADELAAQSSATVVAGTSTGSGPGSPIAVLRASNVANQVSTVDDADFVSGQSVVIQALAVLLAGGKPGGYGMTGNGASAVGPSPAPTPSPSATATASSSPSVTGTRAGNKKGKK